MTSFRFHPADAGIQQIAPPVCAVIIGFPVGTLAPYLVVVGVVTLFAHCNVSRGPIWLDRILVTPGYHRSHHEQQRADTNFALTLPLMDIIFRTACFERGERRFGTTAAVPENRIWSQVRWGLGLSKQQQAQ
jgi:sterol desaturase/sphingolipid hydroxylase (fatty acid hydroxylase superfamily)